MSGEKYKLYYFPFRARGEVIRMVLHAAGVPFDDERIPMDDWPKRKSEIPGGRMPVLQVIDPDKPDTPKNFVESMAIARMLAKRFDLMDDSEEGYYNTERMIGECEDVFKEFRSVFLSPADKKEELLKEAMETSIPKQLDLISKSLSESAGKFVAGCKVTLGDLCLLACLDHVDKSDPEFLKDKYPKLLEWREEVLKEKPKLADYIKSRPDTPF
ncbi:Glutathione S-transferase class-mu 28 kDa isozyme [Clonorchis sinensis]|uniref:Glutathione S-transferase class-mu 28 kDa isozyme n=1 Tax=Clonorchis sinensis TaxID=79923 RepID=A0A3R7DB39_CLOSI|nr:Glutathione S-transferase class-mu 28 kDa isozyme [Clonorchis sinensis]